MYKHGKKDKKKIKIPIFNEEAGFFASKSSSDRMSRINSKNTTIEIKLRKALWSAGCRYRLHKQNIIGKPDLVFTKNKLVVFVDGRFWHGYNWKVQKQKLSVNANKDYWIPKIEANMKRDILITKELEKAGWIVVRIWEHEIEKNLQHCVKTILNFLKD